MDLVVPHAQVDEKIKIEALEKELYALVLHKHTNGINKIVYSQQGDKILTCSQDGMAIVWDASQGKVLCTLGSEYCDGIISAAFDKTGNLVLTVSLRGHATLYNLISDEVVSIDLFAQPSWQRNFICSAEFNKNGDKIVAAYKDGSIKLWDIKEEWNFQTKKPLCVLNRKADDFQMSDLTQTGWAKGSNKTPISSDSVKKNLMKTNDINGERIRPVKPQSLFSVLTSYASNVGHEAETIAKSPCISASFNDAGDKVVALYQGAMTAVIWMLSPDEIGNFIYLYKHYAPLCSAAFNRDGTHILTTSEDGEVKLWDSSTGLLIGILRNEGSEKLVSKVASYIKLSYAKFDSRGNNIITLSPDGMVIRMWDIATGKCLTTTEWVAQPLSSTIITGAHNFIVADFPHCITILDFSASESFGIPKTHKSPLSCVDFNQADYALATVSSFFDETKAVIINVPLCVLLTSPNEEVADLFNNLSQVRKNVLNLKIIIEEGSQDFFIVNQLPQLVKNYIINRFDIEFFKAEPEMPDFEIIKEDSNPERANDKSTKKLVESSDSENDSLDKNTDELPCCIQ